MVRFVGRSLCLNVVRSIAMIMVLGTAGCSHLPDASAPADVAAPDMSSFVPGVNPVYFVSEGDRVAAHLYLPADYEPGTRYPGVVLGPPDAGVKEQTVGVYAGKLSERGYAALAFDQRGFGESRGRHPNLLDQYGIAEDVMSGVSFLRTLDVVDPDRVLLLGIASGSACAVMAASFDTRVRAVAMITPHFTDGDEVLERLGGVENTRKSMMTVAAKGRDHFYRTGEDTYFRLVPETPEDIEEVSASRPLLLQGVEYYLNGGPGDHPNWDNRISVMSMYSILGSSLWHYPQYFDTTPVFIAYGGASSTAWYATRFHDEIRGPKEILRIEGARHFDLYWKPEYVDPAVEGAVDFFRRHVN